MDLHSQQEKAPRVLLGSAVTRLLRIRSLYYELVAVAILGFAGTGVAAVRQPLLHQQVPPRHRPAQRGLRHHRAGRLPGPARGLRVRRPLLPPCARSARWCIAGICITAYGGLFVISLYVPELWMVVALQFLANAAVVPARHLHLPDPGRHRAAGDARHLLRHVRGVLTRLRRVRRIGGARCRVRRHRGLHGITRAAAHRAVCAWAALLLVLGSRYVRRDITLVIEDVIERYAEGKRRQAGGAIPALQVHNLDFFYGTNQVLFDVNLEVARGRDGGPARAPTARASPPCCGPWRVSPTPTAG